MTDRDSAALPGPGRNRGEFGRLAGARRVQRSWPMGHWLGRTIPLCAVLLAGCGASEASAYGGGEVTTVDADGVPFPDTAPLVPDAPPDDAGPPAPKCPPAGKGLVNVCVMVSSGASGPSISSDVTTTLGIDGRGTLMIGVSKAPPDTTGAVTWDSKEIFPSATAGTTFKVEDDLPKGASFAVTPGTYYVWAVFKDQEPFDRPLAVGDYVPSSAVRLDVNATDSAITKDLKIYPLRGVDVDVRLKGGTKPLGNGVGPMRVRLSALDGTTIGEQRISCVDLPTVRTASTRVLTPSAGPSFTLQAALFDFVTSVDDPSLGAASAPAGSLVNSPGEPFKFPDGAWVAPKMIVELDQVVSFGTTPVPVDPSDRCTSYSAAPAAK
jgi:hypothetical protein